MMIAMRRHCLDQAELRQVLDGELSKDAFDSAISHLDQCETCRTAAETLEGSLVVMPADQEDVGLRLQSETACQVALQSLLQSPSHVAPAARNQPPPFETLGPYRLLELIGSGGMGAVYLGEHQRLRRQCAIKLLPPERVTQTGWLERFDREMTTIASLEHPNIVRATDAGHEAGWHYLVMEHLDGLDIGRVASRMGQLNVADACEIVRQAALGLAHIHDSGLVHRDIKPSNLMLTRSGSVKLLDLGLVLDGDDPLSKDDRLTTVGHVMGTMPYMAPEQLADSRDVRPQSDIYSLGATLYRLIAGHPPHRAGRGLASQVLAITSQDAKPLDAVREDVDRDVVTLAAKMLSRDPSKRPASALEVAEALESASTASRLKRLVRDAMRKHDDNDLPHSGIFPSVTNSRDSGNRSTIKRWLIGCAAAAFLFAAGMVIKIQTDRGDLVIHSEQDGLTVVIKQGDQVVERLKVESGKNNRQTLAKGSYRVQIEGGGKALQLSDEVVTIGRGTVQEIDVVAAPVVVENVPIDYTETQPTVTAGVVKIKSEIASLPSTDLVSHDGKTLTEWLTLIENESDIDAIGNAAFSAINALQDAPRTGYSAEAEKKVAIAAILKRAREFGGIKSKLPPLPGMAKQDNTQSEHFMWFLNEAFALPDPTAWLDACADELVAGNSQSRAAVIYCLAKNQSRVSLYNSMGGAMMGGGMGGFGGVESPLSKFTASRLLRYCVSLGKSDAWPGIPAEDGVVAAALARELALVLSSQAGGASYSQLSPELLEVIRSIPVSERTETDKYILMDADKAIVDAVPVADSAQSAHADLTSVESTATDSNQPATKSTLFKGKDLASWMQALDRERDVDSLAEAMLAVEMLSRETDAETRLAAAQRTMSVARRLGGIVIGGPGDENSSHRFMSHFMPTFSRYFSEPGTSVIRSEIANGNSNSQIASLWVLHNYLHGLATGMSSLVTDQSATAWIKDLGSQDGGPEQLHQFSEQLLEFANANADDESDSDRMVNETKMGLQLATEMAKASALWIEVTLGVSVADKAELKSYVTNHVDVARKNREASGNVGPLNPKHLGLSEPLLIAAIQIAAQDPEFGTPECWKFLAASFVLPEDPQQYLQWELSENYLAAFEQFKEEQPEILLAVIHQSLNSPVSLITRSQWYELAIPFYATEFERAQEASGALRFFEGSLDNVGLDASSNLRKVVEQAEAKVLQRMEEQRAAELDESTK